MGSGWPGAWGLGPEAWAACSLDPKHQAQGSLLPTVTFKASKRAGYAIDAVPRDLWPEGITGPAVDSAVPAPPPWLSFLPAF